MPIPPKTGDAAKDQFMRGLLHWMLSAGQRQAADLGYGAIPSEIVARGHQAIDEAH